ncbi:MAG: YihY/virulence factor BrkB family protein [Candidatus Eremiobacteraeota bacterium]|nr:YihY/virulence factor BrkB family protein [Candidatus Eremiobacteraeota bacterium]MBC5827874.1 YihY/virulence factor BrkB family protein [Candidatus Eremiobacteraeota bacterium]
MKLIALFPLFKEAFSQFGKDRATRLAAALSYYTIFAIAPLLIIFIAIAGHFLGHGYVKGQIIDELRGSLGPGGAQAVKTMIEAAYKPKQSVIASTISFAVFLFAAAGVFGQLQDALNTVWHVEQKAQHKIMDVIRDRFASLAMVLGIGFLLLVTLVISAGASALGHLITGVAPWLTVVIKIVDFILSFVVVAVLFGLIFKVLPDTRIRWKDVAIGACVTSLLFAVGVFLIGLYMGHSAVASTYGAAGSLIVILLWIYYAAQIMLFGAEFTKVYAQNHGSRSGGKQLAPGEA